MADGATISLWLGRYQRASTQVDSLRSADPAQVEYSGLLGIAAAKAANQTLARAILRQLGDSIRAYDFGRAQYQAARVAAALGLVTESTLLLQSAYEHAFPFTLEFHRDRALEPVRSTPAYAAMAIRQRQR